MANPTDLVALTSAKLGNLSKPIVKVATPMTATATTLVATSPGFVDEDDAVLATPFQISVKYISGDSKFYSEQMEVTAVAADKVTATVVRGTSDARDYTAGNPASAGAIPKDSIIEIAYSPQMHNMIVDALLGNIGSAKKFNETPTWDTNAGVAQSCPEYADIATGEAAITSPQNGNRFYATAEGVERIYIGGAWTSAASGTTVNATETAAGKIELATVAEQGAQTETGGSGAKLVLQSKNTVKTSSGAGDENKIPVLNASGQLASGFVDALSDSAFTAKGDLLVGTGSGTKTALGVGSDGQVPVADSSEASGVKWGEITTTINCGAQGINVSGGTSTENINHNLGTTPNWVRIKATISSSNGGNVPLDDDFES